MLFLNEKGLNMDCVARVTLSRLHTHSHESVCFCTTCKHYVSAQGGSGKMHARSLWGSGGSKHSTSDCVTFGVIYECFAIKMCFYLLVKASVIT